MMKKTMILCGGALIAGLAAGCASTTTFDPGNPTTNTARAIGTVSQAECFMAARAAAENAMTSPTFDRFLAKYRAEQNDAAAMPLMQVGYLRNDTNDPDLQMNLVTDELCTALLNSGKVEVTLATGRDATQTMSEARDLKKDDNFKQSTVARKGRLEAPRLSLEGSIISNVVREGRDTVQVYSFNLKLADIDSGKVIWTYNKPFGTKQTRGGIGW
jgi:hypothetical protein